MPKETLDKLLNRQPPPETPPWFVVKVMARIRRERSEREEKAAFPLFAWSKKIVLAGCAAALVLTASWMYFEEKKSASLEQEAVFTALAAFEGYQEENMLWTEEELF